MSKGAIHASDTPSARVLKMAGILSKASGGLWRITLVISMLAAIAVISGLIQLFVLGKDVRAETVFFVEVFIGTLMYSVILFQLNGLFKTTVEEGSLFVGSQPKRIRAIALCLLILVICGFLFSCLSIVITHEVVPSLTFGAGFYGFPSAESWFVAFGSGRGYDIGYTATLDVSGLLQVVLVWCLSFAFEMGSALQEEIDYTL